MPVQNAVVAADVMVMPRSCSWLHPVHRRGAVVHLADLVAHAGVEQDALGRGGLAGIDVRHDAEVAVTLDGSGAGHGSSLFIVPKPPTGGPGLIGCGGVVPPRLACGVAAYQR